MQLKSLGLYRNYDKTLYGSMTVEDEQGEIRLKLNHDQAERVVAVVAETLVETAKGLAQGLLAQTIDFKMAKQINHVEE